MMVRSQAGHERGRPRQRLQPLLRLQMEAKAAASLARAQGPAQNACIRSELPPACTGQRQSRWGTGGRQQHAGTACATWVPARPMQAKWCPLNPTHPPAGNSQLAELTLKAPLLAAAAAGKLDFRKDGEWLACSRS